MTGAARRLFVELDNAMGSRRGDVDDGFALAALLNNGTPLLGVGSVFGNSTEAEADRNNRALAAVMQASVPHLRGCARAGDGAAESVDFLLSQTEPFTVLALGPLTTMAAALRRRPDLPIRELVVVGGDATSRGRWPPLWPYEFNLRCDRKAATTVFASPVPITVVPLDVARRALLTRTMLELLPGRFGEYARIHAARWFERARRLFRRDAIRVYDLLAVAAVLQPSAIGFTGVHVRMHRRGWLEFTATGRPARIVEKFDDRVFDLLHDRQPGPPAAVLHATLSP